MTTQPLRIDKLADALVAAAPDLDPAGQRLFLAAYRLLAAGHPVTAAELLTLDEASGLAARVNQRMFPAALGGAPRSPSMSGAGPGTGCGRWATSPGVALFTHVAMYQGRIVADNILGRDRTASYHGIPRVVFADPEIAAVGLTAAQARAAGISIAATELSLGDAIARPWTYERDPRGTLGLLADRDRRVLAGAWAVAPLASEWIHQAALAIRARIPVDVLLDQVAQYPTYSEAYLAALEQLSL
jgi:hypothetical protein